MLLEEIIIGTCCELLVYFYTSGTTKTYWTIKQKYDKEITVLRRYLSISAEVFSGKADTIFDGISFVKSLRLQQGMLMIEQSMNFQPAFVKEMARILDDCVVRQIWEVVGSPKRSDIENKLDVFNLFANAIWDTVLRFSVDHVFDSVIGKAKDLTAIAIEIDNTTKIVPMTSIEFIDYLCDNIDVQCNRCLVQLVRSVKNTFSDCMNLLAEFKGFCAKVFETKLYQHSSMIILHYVDPDKKCVVLPLFPYSDISYSLLSTDSRKVMIRMYEDVVDKCWGIETKLIPIYLEHFEKYPDFNIKMIDFIGSIWLHELRSVYLLVEDPECDPVANNIVILNCGYLY